jgi:hypothetical protein
LASGIPERASERFRVNGLRAACDFATAGGIFRDGLSTSFPSMMMGGSFGSMSWTMLKSATSQNPTIGADHFSL